MVCLHLSFYKRSSNGVHSQDIHKLDQIAQRLRFLDHKLKLKVNEAKSKVAKINKTSFLGFTIVSGKIRWSDAAFAKFKRRIKQLTGRSWRVSLQYRMEQLALYLRGWMNYYGLSQYYRVIPEIDHWLRRSYGP